MGGLGRNIRSLSAYPGYGGDGRRVWSVASPPTSRRSLAQHGFKEPERLGARPGSNHLSVAAPYLRVERNQPGNGAPGRLPLCALGTRSAKAALCARGGAEFCQTRSDQLSGASHPISRDVTISTQSRNIRQTILTIVTFTSVLRGSYKSYKTP